MNHRERVAAAWAERRVRAVTIDAAGTLVLPRESIATTYVEWARRFGARVSVATVSAALRPAMARHRALRAGDPSWRAYWAAVVADATGVAAPELTDALIDHFAGATAWRLADGALACVQGLRAAGLRVAVLSNWDRRLHGTLAELGIAGELDAVLASADLGGEKPEPRVFELAAARLGVAVNELVHVGDDDADDVAGAMGAGAMALHIVRDVGGFDGLLRLFCGEPPATIAACGPGERG